jgi:glycolate oxidase iron-sulfur subunit
MQTNFAASRLADPEIASSEAVIRKCVHCGFCNATCPTYLLFGDELDGPRGRIYLMKEMLETERKPTAEIVKHIDRCLSCLSCMTTCPSGVNYMHLVDHARAYIEDRYSRPWNERTLREILARILPYPRRFRVALALARFVKPIRRLFGNGSIGAMLALVPDHAAPKPAKIATSPGSKKRIALLQGCVEPVLRPEIREATARLLTRLGYQVILAKGEGCCGALVHHMGRKENGSDAARRNIDAWTREIETKGLDAIVITASGCGVMIKDYAFMLRNDPIYAEKAARVSALAKDVSELLTETDLAPMRSPRTVTVAYHSACALQHGQKVSEAPLRLLSAAGFKVRIPRDSHFCCGSAGTYNILQPEIAGELSNRKVANLEELNAHVIVTGNIGCMTQIAARTLIPVLHTVELLDWAAGGPLPSLLLPMLQSENANR